MQSPSSLLTPPSLSLSWFESGDMGLGCGCRSPAVATPHPSWGVKQAGDQVRVAAAGRVAGVWVKVCLPVSVWVSEFQKSCGVCPPHPLQRLLCLKLDCGKEGLYEIPLLLPAPLRVEGGLSTGPLEKPWGRVELACRVKEKQCPWPGLDWHLLEPLLLLRTHACPLPSRVEGSPCCAPTPQGSGWPFV